ncbi:hypothetical protein P167DRAFT_235893 [Morchella conica CCBAS932]|uniref:Ricin B lectin domain-containing protein n=1 Tax=Morchella conica CCBAS932 TaxID=1392247 RepID=A0A3N4KKJ3_9PEZI|nr:hypothetical protein P167DRAFT_235893 [Morchella conica CCBAS932]
MSVHAEEGTTIISLGENNFLTEHDGHAVVGLSTETKWRIKAYQPSDDSPPFFMILLNSEGPEELCLALDTNEGDNENNVMLELLETPRPKTCQLWTFEEKAVMERFVLPLNAKFL